MVTYVNCSECGKKLRSDNSTGFCVKHRNSAPEIIAYKKQHHLANLEKDNARNSRNYYANKVKIDDRACQYCCKKFTPTRIDNYICSRQCGIDNWRLNNREYLNKYHKHRYNSNINRKIGTCLRSRLNKALKGDIKSKGTVALLGCSISELKAHLEAKFQPGMSWENWSLHGWHIDHIVPLSSFNLSSPEELKKACHYSNLQPLWAKDNLKKGKHNAQDSLNELTFI